MKHLFYFIFTIIIAGASSCKQSKDERPIKSADLDSSSIFLDSVKYVNYLNAVKNESTFQFYLVIKVKDLNTGIIRDICTEGDFLDGALHLEYKVGYDSLSSMRIENIQIGNRPRYFEFKDTSALQNLGIDNYTAEDLANFEKAHNIDSLAKVIKNSKWHMRIDDDKTLLLYAHSLFNRGILTGENNCFGGTLCYIRQDMIEKYLW
jgi:hypothetical protein